jgi:hypothetical protein
LLSIVPAALKISRVMPTIKDVIVEAGRSVMSIPVEHRRNARFAALLPIVFTAFINACCMISRRRVVR